MSDSPDWTSYTHTFIVTNPKGEVVPPVTKARDFTEAQTSEVIWVPGAGKKIVLASIICSTSLAGKFLIDASGVGIIGSLSFADNGGATIAGGGVLWQGAVDEVITLTTDVAGPHSITLAGSEQ